MTREKRMRVTHQYPTHHYEFDWEFDPEMFCPWCGAQGSVWCEYLSGDMESPPHYCCAECGSAFGYTLYDNTPEIARQLRTGIQDEPQHQRGG